MPAGGAEQLLKLLEKGKAPPAVVLLGTDSYWRDLCRRALVDTLVPEPARGWAAARLSAEEVEAVEVTNRAQMRPMLAAHQVLFVGEAEAWEKGGDAQLKATEKALEAYFDDPAPFTVVVFEAEKLDKRTRLARLLGERALIIDLDGTGADPARLAARIAADQGIEMDAEATVALVEATAGQAARMAVEMAKLACYAGESRRVTAEDVRALVVPEGAAEVWELAGLLASGERSRALALADDLMRKGEAAPRLVGALAWMYRKLVIAAEVPRGANEWQAARQLGMRPEAAKTAVEHARRLTRAQLAEALEALAEADDRLKSAARDDRVVMEFLLARLSRQDAREKAKTA